MSDRLTERIKALEAQLEWVRDTRDLYLEQLEQAQERLEQANKNTEGLADYIRECATEYQKVRTIGRARLGIAERSRDYWRKASLQDTDDANVAIKRADTAEAPLERAEADVFEVLKRVDASERRAEQAEAEAERLRLLAVHEQAKNFMYEAERAEPGVLLAKLERAEAAIAAKELERAAYAIGAQTARDALAAERAKHTYSHMCRDGHNEIGHKDSENESCPLCCVMDERDALRDELAAERAKRCATCEYEPACNRTVTIKTGWQPLLDSCSEWTARKDAG